MVSLPGARVVAVLSGGSSPCWRRLSSSAALTEDLPQSPSTFFIPASSAAAEELSVPLTLLWPMSPEGKGENFWKLFREEQRWQELAAREKNEAW